MGKISVALLFSKAMQTDVSVVGDTRSTFTGFSFSSRKNLSSPPSSHTLHQKHDVTVLHSSGLFAFCWSYLTLIPYPNDNDSLNNAVKATKHHPWGLMLQVFLCFLLQFNHSILCSSSVYRSVLHVLQWAAEKR